MVRVNDCPAGVTGPKPQHSQDSANKPRASNQSHTVRLEPLPRLEWSLATESAPPAVETTAPASLRRGWIYRAPEDRLLRLFRKLNSPARRLPAPWWLIALDRGELPSRQAALALEDEIHTLLSARTGWVFVPWADVGETGFWEYGPSDREPMTTPTTVLLTEQHQGWINVVRAHSRIAPPPMPVGGIARLRSVLGEIETW